MADHEFSVDQFIQEMNMSKSPFYQKIKALTDQTPSEFVRNLKLKRAAEMLSKGKMQVSEVAYELGFNNLSYFSKSYRNLFGESPSSYMNKYEK